MKHKIIYINEVDIFIDNARGINEREFISELVRHNCVDKIIVPKPVYEKRNDFLINKKIIFLPTVKNKILKSLVYQTSVIFILIYFLLKSIIKKIKLSILIRPSILTFYPLFLIKPGKRIKICFKITDLIAENLELIKKENYSIYTFLIIISKFFHKLILKKADVLITVTPEIKKFYRKKYDIKIPIYVIPNGVNTQKFYPIRISERKKLRKQFKLPTNSIILGYVGVLRMYNVFYPILKALKLLKKNNNIKFVIVGSGPQLESLKELVRKFGLSSNVIFLGKVKYSAIPQIINTFDIGLALFSERKIKLTGTSSLKIYQYLSCGIHVITNYAESHLFIEKYNLGILIRNIHNVYEIVQKVNMLINNFIFDFKIKNNIRKYILDNHSYKNIVINYFRVLGIKE